MQRYLAILACFLLPACCFSQQYPLVYYTPKDGLVNSRVRSIKQDSKGRMLFTTFGGLSCYDGTRFMNYHQQDGLADELVNDVVEVGPDSLLVATNAPRLNTLVRGKIGTYKTADGFYPVVNHFLKSSDGNWYVTADEGLFIFHDKHFTRFSLLDNHGKDIGIYLDKILEWNNYFLMIPWSDNLSYRLIVYDRIQKRVTDIDMENTVINLARDQGGRIWVTTYDGPRLIDTVLLAQGRINLVLPSPQFNSMVKDRHAAIFFDQENNAWLYNKDIVRISPQYEAQHISAEQGLQPTSLTDVFIDREGIVWIATDGNGIIKIRNTNTEVLNTLDQKRISLSTMTYCNDTIWMFNAIDNNVFRYSDNKFKLFAVDKNLAVYNLFVLGQSLYLNSGQKIFQVKNKDDQHSYKHPKPVGTLNIPNGLGAGTTDRNGFIIQYVRESDTSFFLYVLKNETLVMKAKISYFIDQMAFDSRGRLWTATRNNHIVVFSLHPETPSRYLRLEKDYAKELPALNPRAIAIDSNDVLWVGTRYGGLYKFEIKDDRIKSSSQFTTRDGLTDNFIYTLSCDRNNTIWVGTQTGLDKIFLKNGQYIIGNISKNNNFFQTVSKIIVTKNNTVWALTNGGIVLRISQPSSLTRATVVPPVMFTSIRVNDQATADSARQFSYRQNNISFTVAAISFIDERAIRYSYLLEGGGNSSWSEPTNSPTFNFINLPPGNYVLKVRCDFPEAAYPPEFITYAFAIDPPWWESWWFRIYMAVLMVGISIVIIRFYYRRKLERQKVFLEKQQAVERERTRIATDMHDDLGAGLSRIKFLSETIGIKKQQQIPFEEDISKIREYSHEMIDKMGEIVWALNEKNDSVSDLLSYTRSYTVEYLSQSGVSCTIDSPETLPSNFVSGELRRNIFLAVKEVLHNVVKHSQANHVTISIQVGTRLCISIHDDGIGFDRNKVRPYSNGLTNIEKRMKDVGGLMELQNTDGTTVKLTVPLT